MSIRDTVSLTDKHKMPFAYFLSLGSAGVLAGARPKTTSNARNAGIQIFCDENQDPSTLPPQTGQWTTAPKQEVTNKENEKKAGVWTKRKVGDQHMYTTEFSN